MALTLKEKIWEEVFNILSTHYEQKVHADGTADYYFGDDERKKIVDGITEYVLTLIK